MLMPRASSHMGLPFHVTLVTDRTLSWDTEWRYKSTVGRMKI